MSMQVSHSNVEGINNITKLLVPKRQQSQCTKILHHTVHNAKESSELDSIDELLLSISNEVNVEEPVLEDIFDHTKLLSFLENDIEGNKLTYEFIEGDTFKLIHTSGDSMLISESEISTYEDRRYSGIKLNLVLELFSISLSEIIAKTSVPVYQ